MLIKHSFIPSTVFFFDQSPKAISITFDNDSRSTNDIQRLKRPSNKIFNISMRLPRALKFLNKISYSIRTDMKAHFKLSRIVNKNIAVIMPMIIQNKIQEVCIKTVIGLFFGRSRWKNGSRESQKRCCDMIGNFFIESLWSTRPYWNQFFKQQNYIFWILTILYIISKSYTFNLIL